MSRHLRQVLWLTLSALLIGFPPPSHAAEAPGALTIIVKDQITDRPIPTAQITITERQTNTTRSVETDAQGRIVIEQLDPGLYSVNVAKSGFAPSYEPSVRVATRRNIQIEFELGEQVIQEVVVQARQADAF
jgi:5-hydroxyisourate hydrolase-like protein (transthyretin family)